MMVDRLSPIDRSLKAPQPVRQNSRRAIRLLRLRVVGELLRTIALHCSSTLEDAAECSLVVGIVLGARRSIGR